MRSSLLIIILFSLICTLVFTIEVKADYSVKVGDSFKFKVEKIRNISNEPMSYSINDITIAENAILTLNVTTVNLPFEIEYAITSEIDGVVSAVNEYSLFWQTIFQNRTWDKLTDYYELLNYEVTQNNRVWSAKLEEGGGVIEAEFLKEDGVLNKIYISDYPLLRAETGIKTLDIQRTWTGQNASVPFLITIPIFTISLIFLSTFKRKINKDGM